MSNPKTRQKCQSLLYNITGVISRVVTHKDKAIAMSSPLTKRLNQGTGVMSGDSHPKTILK